MEEKQKNTVRRLLDIPAGKPEERKVLVNRLGLEITLRELPYDKLISLQGTANANIKYLLASAVSPEFRSSEWYQEHMGCPTPVDALKKLLRAGEIRALVREADKLNGYDLDSITTVELSEEELQGQAIQGALEELEKNEHMT